MSFLFVKGIIYHCLQCGSSLQVEYEGGPMFTQVGEGGVFNFLQLEKKYKSNSGRDLYREPVYLHAEVICENCVDSSRIVSSKLVDKVDSLWAIARKAGSIKKQFQNNVLKLIENSDIEWVKSVDRKSYEEMANHKYLLMPHVKNGQVVPIILGEKEKRIRQYISEISGNILESLFSAFPQLKDNLLASVSKIRQKLESRMEEIKKKLPGEGTCFYVGEDITLPENMNPYIMTEWTVRVPEDKTPNVKCYTDIEIDMGDMEEWLTGLDKLATSQYYQQDEKLVNEVTEVLDRLLKKELAGS
jgi:hypothetical protein